MKIKFWSLLIVLILLSSAITSCKTSEPQHIPTVSCVFILGNHANANYIGDNTDSEVYKFACDMIERSMRQTRDANSRIDITTSVNIIISDSVPSRVDLKAHNVKTTAEDIANSSAKYLNPAKEEIISSISSFMFSKDLRADDEEVDLLAALSEAQKILSFSDAEEKHIVIIDTGITTSGFLNMTKDEYNIMKTDLRNITASLPEAAYPDLTGIHVSFMGLGNVAWPQDDMRNNNTFTNNLQTLWTQILLRSNATISNPILYAVNEGTPMMYYETPDDEDPGYPYVTRVYFFDRGLVSIVPNQQVIMEPIPEVTTPPVVEVPEPEPEKIKIVFAQQEFGFKGDSAAFKNGDSQAIYAINQYIDQIGAFLNDDFNNKLYIVGSIAHTKKNLHVQNDPLALARAEAVSKLLIERFNIPESRLVVIDAGSTVFTWRCANEFPDGVNWSRPDAEKNRIVALIGSTSESEVAELREQGYIE